MVLKEALLKEHSKRQTQAIANYIGTNQGKFDELLHLFFFAEPLVGQRAAWVVSTCVETKKELLQRHIKPFIHNLSKADLHDAVKRGSLKALQEIVVPDPLLGSLVEICFGFLYGAKEAIAVKSLSIKILVKTCQQYPELMVELTPLLMAFLNHESPALVFTSKQGLASLKKITTH